MKLHHLSARNFRSFAHLELPLNVEGLIAVIGPNGAGKTSIFQAIEWALYGSPPGRGLPVCRDHAGGPCQVTVEFEVGDRAYVVHRVDQKDAWLRDSAADPADPPLADGRAGTTRYVAALLGLTREMFRGTFYARQREVQALDPADDAKRRQQVELLLGIERLRLAHGHASSAAKSQQQLVASLAAQTPDVDTLASELAQIREQVADQAKPVRDAEAQVERRSGEHTKAKSTYQELRQRERLTAERRAHAERARGVAGQRTASVESLTAQVKRGEQATQELAKLEPVAARAPQLIDREHKLRERRNNHERGTDLRRRRDEALHDAARVADQIVVLEDEHAIATQELILAGQAAAPAARSGGDDARGPRDARDAAKAVSDAERQLADVSSDIRATATQVATAHREAERIEQLLARAARARELDDQLTELPAAEAAVEQALERWQQLSARQRQLADALTHDTEHRDAVLAGTTVAKCPTCQRDFAEGEREQIVDQFDRTLAATRDELTQLEIELRQVTEEGKARRATVKRLHALAADRRALGEPHEGDLQPARLDVARNQAADLGDGLERLEAHAAELEATLPRLRSVRDTAEKLRRRREELHIEHQRHADRASVLAQELDTVGVNGYDPVEHQQISAELIKVQEAVQRCSMLRGQADGLDLLRRRLAEECEALTEAQAELARCEAALAEVSVEPEEVARAEQRCDELAQAVSAAQVAVVEARQQVAAQSEAVGVAQARLVEGRRQNEQLRRERRELELRREVTQALSAFREEASRRARPTLAQHTSLLLGQTTRGRYSAVQLTDTYQLEIIDRERIYPLKRFSGGEQDLASLCLRLALSRTLAGQRGAETGFVLLDEVFGSQDPDRRQALLEQLHALADSEFRQVFVVSHTDDVVGHCDLTIEVSRDDNGVSRALPPRR